MNKIIVIKNKRQAYYFNSMLFSVMRNVCGNEELERIKRRSYGFYFKLFANWS